MPRGRPLSELTLSPAENDQLVALTRSRSMPHALVSRWNRTRGLLDRLRSSFFERLLAMVYTHVENFFEVSKRWRCRVTRMKAS